MTDKEYQHALDLMIRGARADERAKTIDECIKITEECCWRDSEMLVELFKELKGEVKNDRMQF